MKIRYITAPDSFKGTLSSAEAAEAVKAGILEADNEAEVITLPIADGGEGSVDALGAKRMVCEVTGPDGEKLPSFWGLMPDGETAVIEMAACAGLPQTKLKNPELTTTYGVGELIKAALAKGIRRFIVGLGGSATNDAGCGMAAALGVVFTDKEGNAFVPKGGTLSDIAHIDMSGIDSACLKSSFTVMCDITNPLYGEKGAAYVFAPQKGADEAMVERLDMGLRNFASVVKKDLGCEVDFIPGSGAAGGMGAGMCAFLGAELKSGIDTVLELRKFDDIVTSDTIVITGEGKFDSQSVGGKAVSGIAARAKKKGAPVIILCGSADEVPEAYEMGVTAVFSIQTGARPLEKALPRNGLDMRITASNIARVIKATRMIEAVKSL